MKCRSISRRSFLAGLAAACAACGLHSSGVCAAPREGALPILMFHKVCDHPRRPEEISPGQLARLFDLIWQQGFAPCNVRDMLLGRIDAVLPKGRKALGITVDDAHPSVIHASTEHQQAATARSFVDIFADSAKRAGLAPRATFFLSGQRSFGGKRGLAGVLDQLASLPGLECGYHTRNHPKMTGWGYQQTRRALEEQMGDFKAQNVFERIPRILAWPYGLPPADDGVRALEDLDFLGAMLAFPGVREAKYTSLPVARYSPAGLLSPRFHIPRVNIGAYIYAPQGGIAPRKSRSSSARTPSSAGGRP
ncbi:MAG: polysaccharide deacetylase family protein [Deltaproteobacteria bacterium]|nr:polysaccharide deacetylase family protein [Deltaproteobacteria bacterium]